MNVEFLSPATAVFLLVDHQTGVFERVVKAPPRDQVKTNVLRLARAAAILDIPAIFTTSEEEGENGALLPEFEQILPTPTRTASTATGSLTRSPIPPSLTRSRPPAAAN
jgi:nicotinamidase-related amidase